MNYLERAFNNFKYIYSEINAATLTGAIDVVVVEQPDGSFTCSPFHVRFGKMGVLRSKEKIVDIEINGEPVDIHMKLGESGEAFFVEEVVDEEEEVIPPHLATSPIPPSDACFPADWAAKLREDSAEDMVAAGRTFKADIIGGQEASILPPTNSDFRPIDSRSSEDGASSSKESNNSAFVKEDSPSGDEASTTGNTTQLSASAKRKRRKRSMKKRLGKRGSQGEAATPQTSVQQDIFCMDDLDTPQNIPGPPPPTPKEEPPCTLPVPDRDIHFFSDTEITPGSSPRRDEFCCDGVAGGGTGAVGPVQSDTEFETNKDRDDLGTDSPDSSQSWKWGELPSPSNPAQDIHSKHHSQKWMANMLGFMKRTKHMRHENEGVYLSELNFDDPEISSLYLSTLQERHIANGDEVREEDTESGNGPSLPQSPHSVECCSHSQLKINYAPKWYDISLSLCGFGAPEEEFERHIVTYADLAQDPNVIFDSKLVIRIDNKVMNWKQAAPMMVSLLAFRKPLPEDCVARMESQVQPAQTPCAQAAGVQPTSTTYKSWFSWGVKNGGMQPTTPNAIAPVEVETAVVTAAAVVETGEEPQEQPLDLSLEKKPVEKSSSSGEKYRKTLRLTSDQISKLNLEPGANEVEFSVTTAYQGTSKCKCCLFRWRWDDKIVISDIDGTITKSDVLGHILPIVGKDWAQSGVAKLFTRIKENGYKLLYLSARAIGQSRLTRDYLKSIKQEDLNLPEGPVLLNPTSLLHAFHTEVIERKPEEFKISCLRDIQALFPPSTKPFYAGYGNKINDVWAYQAVGIPIFRIFTINHRGELKHELTQTFQSTYSSMSNLVDQMFPIAKPSHVEYDFTEFVYWRQPIMDVESLPAL